MVQALCDYQPAVPVVTLFLLHSSTPAPAVGIRESSSEQMDGELGGFGQGGCQAMLVHVLVLELSVCLSFLQCQLCGLFDFSFASICDTK